MGELSIKVTIAGRVYPLTIRTEEEEGVRKAAKPIEENIQSYSQNYSVKDKQDLLAMCALQFATQMVNIDSKAIADGDGVTESLIELEAFVSGYLKKE